MSSIFDGYLEEHSEICAGIGRSVAQLRGETDLEMRRKLQRAAESELTKAEELVQQMELEARSAPKSDMRAMQTRAKTCRSEVGCLRTSLKQAFCSVPAGSEAMHGSSGDEAGDSDQRARLLKMNERVMDGTSVLQKAHRTVLETEAVGISIMSDLQAQREVPGYDRTRTHAAHMRPTHRHAHGLCMCTTPRLVGHHPRSRHAAASERGPDAGQENARRDQQSRLCVRTRCMCMCTCTCMCMCRLCMCRLCMCRLCMCMCMCMCRLCMCMCTCRLCMCMCRLCMCMYMVSSRDQQVRLCVHRS